MDGKDGSRTGSITSTDAHLIWLPDAGVWAKAEQFKAGMWLQTAAGTWVQITAVKSTVKHERVHNLTVDGVHSYYVLANGAPLLVHNNNSCDPDLFDEFDVTPGQGFDATVPSAGNRSYITYAFKNDAGDVTYVGGASGKGTSDQILAGRLSRGHDHYLRTVDVYRRMFAAGSSGRQGRDRRRVRGIGRVRGRRRGRRRGGGEH